METLILDGSNLCHEGQKKSGRFKSLGALLPCLRALLTDGIEAYVIFDASFRYRVEKNSRAAAELETLLKKDDKFRMAPAGTPADVFILEFAALRDFGVLSNDTFRQYVERKGKGKEPHFNGKRIQLHSFQMLMGAFIIPSLRISYLIDDEALNVDDIIAARADDSQLPEELAGRPASRTAKPAAPHRPSKARPDASGVASDGQASAAGTKGPRLDFLLKLSPFCLRARDAFEAYRHLTGKSWKAGNSKKTAGEFARECFPGNVVYVEPTGRAPNDGYFFASRYGEERHISVRSYLLENCPRMLPLVASRRGLLLPALELIHDSELASGFNFQRLCEHADALRLLYYRNYLYCLLYALVAADGVRGTDPEETDILAILAGEMKVNPDQSKSDRLNFFQRGILYLLASDDNRLPDVIGANMSWMLLLPDDERIRQAIIQGHLDWLASED